MKSLSLLLAMGCLLLMGSCKKENNPVEEQNASFVVNDLSGNWKGNAANSSNTISLSLNVGDSCRVSGCGVYCTWNIDQTGKVTGDGTFVFTSGGSLVWTSSSWRLQMCECKSKMKGEFSASMPELGGMQVTLTKQ